MNEPDRCGFLVISGPDDPSTGVWRGMVEKGLEEGREVHLYLIDRGVFHLMDDHLVGSFPETLRLYACAYGARRYGVPLTKQAVYSGLAVLSQLMAGCPEFVSFPPTHEDPKEEVQVEWDRPIDRGHWSPRPPEGRSPYGLRPEEGEECRAVLYIRWDPKVSHLPVEGLRIGAGLTVGWPSPTICLNRPATPLLDLQPDEVIDGENRDSYLDILIKSGAVFCHEGDLDLPSERLAHRRITADEKKGILSGADRLIVV